MEGTREKLCIWIKPGSIIIFMYYYFYGSRKFKVYISLHFLLNVLNERPSFNKVKIRFLVAYCQQHIKNHSTYLIAIIIKKFK